MVRGDSDPLLLVARLGSTKHRRLCDGAPTRKRLAERCTRSRYQPVAEADRHRDLDPFHHRLGDRRTGRDPLRGLRHRHHLSAVRSNTVTSTNTASAASSPNIVDGVIRSASHGRSRGLEPRRARPGRRLAGVEVAGGVVAASSLATLVLSIVLLSTCTHSRDIGGRVGALGVWIGGTADAPMGSFPDPRNHGARELNVPDRSCPVDVHHLQTATDWPALSEKP